MQSLKNKYKYLIFDFDGTINNSYVLYLSTKESEHRVMTVAIIACAVAGVAVAGAVVCAIVVAKSRTG